jgi:hypothetical protein
VVIMQNDVTPGDDRVSQGTLETIIKLAHSGISPEDISFVIRVDIESVWWIIADDPRCNAREVQSIKERSAKYRCAQSNRLMISPVMARDGNFYEQSILEANPSHSREIVMPSKELRAKIEEFSKESLKMLEKCLRQKDPHEDIVELTAECLSVLRPDAGVETALRVLGTVEGKTVKRLLGKLRGLVPVEMLLSLMSQLAKQFPSHAFCLAALIILQPSSERALGVAFRYFAELLSQVALDAGALNLVEEVSEKLSSSQLSQINEALGACPWEGGDRLDGLRLKEAYALLKEGKVEAAICLVNTLRISPRLENEVLRFFDEAGLSRGKVPILEQRLSAKLEEISRDSPSVAETLSLVHQLLKAEIQSQKSEAADQSLISLKAEILNEAEAKLGQHTNHALIAQDARIQRLEEQAQRKEADYQKAVSSLRKKVKVLTAELVMAGQAQAAQGARIQELEMNEASLKTKVEALTAEHVMAGQATSQAQTAKDAQIRRLDEKHSKAEVESQKAFNSLSEKVEALKVEEIKQVMRAQGAKIQSLDKKISMTEAATQHQLNSLRCYCYKLSKDLDDLRSQCKQVKRFQKKQFKIFKCHQKQNEANALKLHRELTETKHSLQDTKEALYHLHELTQTSFIYSYTRDTNQLHRTSLVTGKQSSHKVPSYTFKPYCCWTEVPAGGLLITGGGDWLAVKEVVRIGVRTLDQLQCLVHSAKDTN